MFSFSSASITICAVSIIFKFGGNLAEEFIPVRLHAANQGDYSADADDLHFQKVSLEIIMDILLDQNPAAENIGYRGTAIAYHMLTPVPTVTPHFQVPVGSDPPTSSNTNPIQPVKSPFPTQPIQTIPAGPGTEIPTKLPTLKPTNKPVTWPTNPLPLNSHTYQSP